MSVAAISRCGTVCEASFFDPLHRVTTQGATIDDTEEDDNSPVTDDQRSFAHRSQDHLSLAIIMGPIPATRLIPVAVTLRMGLEGDHLPYPRDYLVKKLRTFSEDEQAEAWELFGKGVEP
jgi:hypothetical protein